MKSQVGLRETKKFKSKANILLFYYSVHQCQWRCFHLFLQNPTESSKYFFIWDGARYLQIIDLDSLNKLLIFQKKLLNFLIKYTYIDLQSLLLSFKYLLHKYFKYYIRNSLIKYQLDASNHSRLHILRNYSKIFQFDINT